MAVGEAMVGGVMAVDGRVGEVVMGEDEVVMGEDEVEGVDGVVGPPQSTLSEHGRPHKSK
eukprot:1276551-Pyramimonas_sp.AAC.3